MSARKFVLLCLTPLAFLFSFAAPALAQSPASASATPSAIPQAVTAYPAQSPQYANLIVINLIHTFSCLAEGVSIIGQPCIDYQFQTDGPNKGASAPYETQYLSGGGALGSVAGILTTMYTTPPTSTVEYLADVRDGLGIVQPAYAQVEGSGNNVLSPVLTLWKLSRNLAYFFMIVIFITIGFMVMFRQKINPQTVISAQAALPGLVVGLILITFSYFLAALTVDMTFVATHVAGKVFEEGEVMAKGTTDTLLADQNVLTVFNNFINPTLPQQRDNAIEVVKTTMDTVTSLKESGPIGSILSVIGGTGGCLIAKQLAPDAKVTVGVPFLNFEFPWGKAVACVGGGFLTGFILSTEVGGKLAGGLGGAILYIILMLALLIAMFKLLFSLISAYITILISTITAPFSFLIGSIPGKQSAVGDWFKNMFANLMAFPAVFAALIFAAYLLKWTGEPFKMNPANGPGNFQGTIPLLGGFSPEFLRILLAYGILLALPSIPEAIKNAFGIKGQPGIIQAAMGTFMGGFNVGKQVISKGTAGIQKRRKAAEEAYFAARHELDPAKRAQMIEQVPKRFGGITSWGINKWGIDSNTVPARARAYRTYSGVHSAWQSRRDEWLRTTPGATPAAFPEPEPGTPTHPTYPQPPPEP